MQRLHIEGARMYEGTKRRAYYARIQRTDLKTTSQSEGSGLEASECTNQKLIIMTDIISPATLDGNSTTTLKTILLANSEYSAIIIQSSLV